MIEITKLKRTWTMIPRMEIKLKEIEFCEYVLSTVDILVLALSFT